MGAIVLVKDGEGGYHLLSEAVKLVVEYTKSWDIDWNEFRVIKGKGWRITCADDGDWVLKADDPKLLMYVQLKI